MPAVGPVASPAGRRPLVYWQGMSRSSLNVDQPTRDLPEAEAFAPTATREEGRHHTSVISDVLAAVARGDDSEPTLPTFSAVETVPAIPGYEVLGVLGRGGMGIVYKARHVELDRIVAIKMILSSALADPQAQTRFLAEARVIAHLQHPNIVAIHEVGKCQGAPYFVLEYMGGGTLAHYLRRQPVSPRAAAALLRLLADAMQYAHGRGVIHRDLKPGNVLLSGASSQFSVVGPETKTASPPTSNSQLASASPKISDFGLAKAGEEEGVQTKSGDIVGTPNYMAPEQIDRRWPGVGPHTDVYALGAVLYEMLTGGPPFSGATPMETLNRVLTQPVVPPSRLRSGIPGDLETICLKCLQADPSRRYPTAADLGEDLRRFLAGEPILARPVPLGVRAWKWVRRNPVIAALSWSLLVLLVGSLGLISHWYLQARRNLEDAHRKFDLANQAVDKLTTAGDSLHDASDIPEVRRQMLQAGLGFYEQFLSERGNDPQLRHQTANALRRVGDLQYQLGSLAESEVAFREATQMLADLVREQPRQLSLRYDEAMAWKGLGITLANLRRFTESEAAYRKAGQLAEALVARDPAVPDYRRLLGDALNNLGLRLIAQSRYAEAEECYRRAISIREAMVREEPDSLEKHLHLASIWSNHALLLARQGRTEEAIQRHLDALNLRRRAWESRPGASSYRKMMGDTCLALAELYTRQGRREAADFMFTEGLKHRRGLARDFPTLPNHRRDLGNSVHDHGAALALDQSAASQAEAAKLFRQAAELWRDIARDFPDRKEFQRRAQLMQAYVEALEGRTQGLAPVLNAALEGITRDGEPVFLAARVAALAARTSQDPALRAALEQLTRDLLARSWNLDYFRARWQPAELQWLHEFQGLLEKPEFQSLLTSLDSPG